MEEYKSIKTETMLKVSHILLNTNFKVKTDEVIDNYYKCLYRVIDAYSIKSNKDLTSFDVDTVIKNITSYDSTDYSIIGSMVETNIIVSTVWDLYEAYNSLSEIRTYFEELYDLSCFFKGTIFPSDEEKKSINVLSEQLIKLKSI